MKTDQQKQAEELFFQTNLTKTEIAEAVGVSRRTIYNWISAGKVEYVRTAGGSIRIFADTLWRDAASPRPADGDAPRPGSTAA